METDNEEDIEASKESLLPLDNGKIETENKRPQIFKRYEMHPIERNDKRGKIGSGWHNLQRLVVFMFASMVRTMCPRKPSTRYERANPVDDEDLHHHTSPTSGSNHNSTHLLFRCFMPQNFRFLHLLVIVFFFLFFVIQLKPSPVVSSGGGHSQSRLSSDQSSSDYQQQQRHQQLIQSKWYQQHLNSIRDLFNSNWRDKASTSANNIQTIYYGQSATKLNANVTQSNDSCPLVPPKLGKFCNYARRRKLIKF